jgi:hypothetical protein
MGIDLEYQAMPPDCELIRRARIDPDFGSYLGLFRFYAHRIDEEFEAVESNKALSDFLIETRRLMEDYPGIEDRNLYFGRQWDVLHYLLSEHRRGEQENEEPDWVQKAIHGGDILHEKTVTGIGVRITYLEPEEVSDISARLDSLDFEEIGERWNRTQMLEAGVYKIVQMHEHEWTEEYERLRDFYLTALLNNEGILVFWQ